MSLLLFGRQKDFLRSSTPSRVEIYLTWFASRAEFVPPFRYGEMNITPPSVIGRALNFDCVVEADASIRALDLVDGIAAQSGGHLRHL